LACEILSSSELECAATSTTLHIRYRFDFKLAKLAFLARSSSTSVQHICTYMSFVVLQLCQLRSIRSSLSETSCLALVHAFVTSRLDYCNSLLTGIGDGLIAQLQPVIRVAARLILRRRKFDPISADIRDRLHWLPIRSRIDFKLGLLVDMSARYRSTVPRPDATV